MSEPQLSNFLAVIKVVGVGGAGGNAVNQMIDKRLRGVEFIAINTDGQDLLKSEAHVKLEIGTASSRSLGAGADPTVGKKAAEDHVDEIAEVLRGSDLVFVAVGEGGGTGTGAAPIVARAAKQAGALTVGVVTKPFTFEGRRRMENALAGIEELRKEVDTLVVVPNQKLIEINDSNLTQQEAFSMADDVLRAGVQGISDLITVPGFMNVDFADVKAIMQGAGTVQMGIGTAKGEDRALRAVENAIHNPLLESSIDGARGALIHFAAASDMKLNEMDEAGRLVQELVHPDANIIVGTSVDNTLGDEIRITVIAAGFDDDNYRPSSIPAQRVATPVVETPVVQEPVEVVAEPNWFGGNTGSVPLVQEDVVEELPTPRVEVAREPERQSTGFFGRRKEQKKFDDGFDIPDFLKDEF